MSSADLGGLFAVFDDSSDADDAPAPEEVPQSTAASSVLQMVETATAGAGWLPEALAEQLGPHPPSLTALRGVNRFWRQAVSSASAVWARCCAQDCRPRPTDDGRCAVDRGGELQRRPAAGLCRGCRAARPPPRLRQREGRGRWSIRPVCRRGRHCPSFLLIRQSCRAQ